MTANRRSGAALDAETLLAHGAWLAAVARALVARDDEVDDVVQQTYARALERPPAHHGNVKGWLGTVARNVWRSRSRADRSRVAREAAVAPPTPVETPHEAVERAELRRLVVESVLALDEPYRSTVILRFFEEREMADIARLTSAGEETVRTRLRRGLQRVRQMLERSTSEGTGDAVREGVAARALLFARLRDIAASGGGGGAPGSAAASRGLARAGRGVAPRLAAPSTLVGAAALLAIVAAGGWIWLQQQDDAVDGSLGTSGAAEVAEREGATQASSGSSESLPPALVADRRPEPTVPASPPEPMPAAPAAQLVGTIRGVVVGPDGAPVAGAHVWAIYSPTHRAPCDSSEFPPLARAAAEHGASNSFHEGWIAQRSAVDGSYEFNDLSLLPGWTIGAFDPASGAGMSEPLAFSRAEREKSVDLQLARGAFIRGSVIDEAGAAIGGATVTLSMGDGRGEWRAAVDSMAIGSRLGDYDLDFRCGDWFEVSCAAPTFQATERRRVEIAHGAMEIVAPIQLKRAAGVLAQGAIVDSRGDPTEIAALLETRFAGGTQEERLKRATVWAIALGAQPSEPLVRSGSTPGVIEGRLDLVQNVYQVVVPGNFSGRIELRLDGQCVAASSFTDPHAPPAIVCDKETVPEFDYITTWAARFVDANTRAPLDLREATDRLVFWGIEARLVAAECDLERGLVALRGNAGLVTLMSEFPGYAPTRFILNVRRRPDHQPITLEVAPAVTRLHGFAYRSDGRPISKAEVEVLRATPDGWIDATTFPFVTNADGEFELAAVAAGEHAVVISGLTDEAPGIVRFVPSEATTEIQVRTTPGRTVHLRLRWKAADLGAHPPTTLAILDQHGLPVVRLNNFQSGSNTMPLDSATLHLDDGRYTIDVESEGYRNAIVDFDVPRELLEILLEPQEPR